MRLSLLALISTGCSTPYSPSADPSSTAVTAPSTTITSTANPSPSTANPSVRIISPSDGSTLTLEPDCSLDLHVTVDVEHFTLVSPPGPVVEGVGHWRAEILGEDVFYLASKETGYFLMLPDSISTGTAELHVSLRDSNWEELDPGVNPAATDSVEIDIANPTGGRCP